ncbi:MAG: DUF1348 family protein [Actinobacteria bacterium]|nr:DUF1348 family protein [Actinomycetota bacterium]
MLHVQGHRVRRGGLRAQGSRAELRYSGEWLHAQTLVHWCGRHGNEHWEFDEEGYMRRRDASINNYEIGETERRYTWVR